MSNYSEADYEEWKEKNEKLLRKAFIEEKNNSMISAISTMNQEY